MGNKFILKNNPHKAKKTDKTPLENKGMVFTIGFAVSIALALIAGLFGFGALATVFVVSMGICEIGFLVCLFKEPF